MMAGNPNWWSMMMNGMHPQVAAASPASQFIYGGGGGGGGAAPFPSSNSVPDDHHASQDFPVRSWSQLLLGGGAAAERYSTESLFQQKKMQVEDWQEQEQEDDEACHAHHPHQALNLNPPSSHFMADHHHPVKQEFAHQFSNGTNWPTHHVSSPNSCTTSLTNTFLNFSAAPPPPPGKRHHTQDHSSECNSSSSGGASKKARVHASAQPALKVRKEKLGDRITALHQLVSPFGKTDTASVLSEAIGYIRFLQGQIEALSSPYMCSASGGGTVQHLHSGPEGPGARDLRSRGLCLVPISCTQNVAGGDCGGADYWAPAAYGGASAF